MKNLQDFRKNYTKFELDESDIKSDPLAQFNLWFADAVEDGTFEANAMIVSTVNKAMQPSARVVLLKQIVREGFIFYTNYDSKKGKEIEQNPMASILFFWEKFERQVRIEGIIEKIPEEMSDDYFKNRPKASQLGALVSKQSERLQSRKVLEKAFEEIKNIEEIKKPSNWGGYVLKPNYFEFWQGRANRLHDRIIYKQKDKQNNWSIERLYP